MAALCYCQESDLPWGHIPTILIKECLCARAVVCVSPCILLGFLILLCHYLSSSSHFSFSPFSPPFISYFTSTISDLPNSTTPVSLSAEVWVREGGREEGNRKEKMREKERERKIKKKPFPTVTLSSVAAAQFIHSNNHKQKMQALQVCVTFKILPVVLLHIFQDVQGEFRNKTTHTPFRTPSIQ